MTDVSATAQSMKADGNQFAVATVVRTISVTAAKPGAKAIIDAAGAIVEGWIGGGCARHAVIKAAVKSISDGEPRLVSIQPEELLNEQGLIAGKEQDGVIMATNMCPSRGSMEIFIEPVLSDPQLLIMGTSPVAKTLAEISRPFAFNVLHSCNHTETLSHHSRRYIVVATQGSGDLNALLSSVALQAQHVSFVGSHKKTVYLKKKLLAMGADANSVELIKGPAGLDIGAVTPQEIALSILAEIVATHRQKLSVMADSPRQ